MVASLLESCPVSNEHHGQNLISAEGKAALIDYLRITRLNCDSMEKRATLSTVVESTYHKYICYYLINDDGAAYNLEMLMSNKSVEDVCVGSFGTRGVFNTLVSNERHQGSRLPKALIDLVEFYISLIYSVQCHCNQDKIKQTRKS
jgi:hypothetical protein